MTSMNTRLNIEKLDVNIVQKHGGSKQVGLKQLGHKQVRFKQLGFCVETRVHGVQDEKHVWFKVELQGAQGNREAEGFQVSNDDDAVAQRRLKDKQLEEKTNTNCLESVKYRLINVFGWRWNDREFKGNVKMRFFRLVTMILAQRWLEDKQPEEKINIDCLVKEQKKVHLVIKVGPNITVTGVPG
nr:hypothetical protein [Tanacetum cinerariifolium]